VTVQSRTVTSIHLVTTTAIIVCLKMLSSVRSGSNAGNSELPPINRLVTSSGQKKPTRRLYLNHYGVSTNVSGVLENCLTVLEVVAQALGADLTFRNLASYI
jgi:hypothetical protein